MSNRVGGEERNIFGGVVFTRADRDDIRTLGDLTGRSFAAVDRTSLGGFQMAWAELSRVGIDPYEDFARLTFAGIHDAVVLAVRGGEIDAGTVRTDILERMAAAGAIALDELRILNPRTDPDFPLVHSTPLFPEWPFGKVRHTPNAHAERVAITLLSLPRDHPAARGTWRRYSPSGKKTVQAHLLGAPTSGRLLRRPEARSRGLIYRTPTQRRLVAFAKTPAAGSQRRFRGYALFDKRAVRGSPPRAADRVGRFPVAIPVY